MATPEQIEDFLGHLKDQGLILVSIQQVLDMLAGADAPDLSARPINPVDVELFPEFGPARFVTPLPEGQIGR